MSGTPTVVLGGADLEGLELLFSGLLGNVNGYCLPGTRPAQWLIEPTLRVPHGVARLVSVGTDLIAQDPDGTPLASIAVAHLLPTGDGSAWLAGSVAELRRPEHGPARALRLSPTVDFSDSVVASFSGAARSGDVLRAVSAAKGRQLELVAVGSQDAAESARLVADLEDCAPQVGARVWYVPSMEWAGEVEISSYVIRKLGARSPLEFRQKAVGSPTGAVVLFTGLSGAGKSTIARALVERVMRDGTAKPVLLDGDHIRRELAAELSFSLEDRDRNLRRIAWVAARVAEAGGLAVCAPIAPFEASRAAMRAAVEPDSPFLMVYVSTPLAVAEQRDRKGLYKKARAGLISDFTGIDSPYEPPADADVIVDSSEVNVEDCVSAVVRVLEQRALLSEPPAGT